MRHAMKKRKKSTKQTHALNDEDAPSINNLYTGWNPTQRENSIDVVDVQSLCWKTMFKRYISRRKPVLIKGHLQDSEWLASTLWTNAFLKKTAGHCKVRVETRSATQDKYGKGKYTHIDFGHFISKLENGEELLYMTTQDNPEEDLMCPPLTALREEGFPLRPQLFSGLVPASLNLWLGKSSTGSSSGLHHDYHDNLYVLLRGRKRFCLYSPSSAAYMSTRGNIVHIHKNGMIVYENIWKNADGSNESDRNRARILRLLHESEGALHGQDEPDEEAEEKLEKALDLELDMLAAENACGLERGLGFEEVSETESIYKDAMDKEAQYVGMTSENTPLNFSTLAKESALLERCPCLNVVVEKGSMLYIPAGWFHNVESESGKDSEHMAFNYWFHPPDGCDVSKPYTNSCWEDTWAYRH